MTFPDTPRPMLYELQIGATDWANVTPYAFALRAPTDVVWGIPGEYSQSSPTEASFWLNNVNGLFSPRNPGSVLHELIGRNTPVRISMGEGAYGMVLGLPDSTESNGRAESLDSAQLSPTGDLDLRIDMEILEGSTRQWDTGNFDLITKYINVDSDRSYAFVVIGGKPRLVWTTAGTLASQRVVDCSVFLPGPGIGRKTLRVTLDVDNGAGQSVVTFYRGDSVNGPWTVLGAPVNSAGASSVFNGSAITRIGANRDASPQTWGMAPHATVYEAQLRSGINGTIIASPNFAAQPLDPVPFGLSNFSDAQGNNWTFNGSADAARIWYGDVDIRAHLECSSFPDRWDPSENDHWVPIEAAGMLRRLGRGQEPAATGLRDWIQGQDPPPTSYFPLAGSAGTKYSLNLGDIGANNRFYAQGAPIYTYGTAFTSPYLGTGLEINATGPTTNMRGDVGTADENFALDFVFQSQQTTDDTGTDKNTNMGVLDFFIWNYSGNRFQLRLNTSANAGTAQVTFYSDDGLSDITFPATAFIPALLDNDVHTCRFEVDSVGTVFNNWRLYIDGVLIDSDAAAPGFPWNGTWMYQVQYSRYVGHHTVILGHLALWSDPGAPAPPAVADFHAAAMGYAGELAGVRMARVAALGNIPMTIIGDTAETMAMGPQYSESKLTQLRDAEAADMGFLLEPRDRFGLEYRTRVSMVGQTPALTLSYAAGHLVAPFEPTDDDQFTKNDVTATRREGDSVRAQLTTGKLSVLEPPEGVGRYHDQVELNVASDALLGGIAAWLVNLGTIDQARYPSVTVDLGILAGFGLDEAARAVKAGDLLVVEDMQSVGVYEPVRLLVLGGREIVSEGGYRHIIGWNCAPYTGFEGAVYATSASVGAAHYDTAGSELSAGVTTTATSLSVANTGGTLWTTDASAFPFDIMIGGERITVSTIAGISSPQTFTVVRSVNGVVKTHAAGADVRLADPAYYSL